MTATVLGLPAVIDLVVPASQTQGRDVNYPGLQTVLHVIVQQLGLSQTKIEFRGSDSQKVQDILKKAQDDNQRTMEFKIVHEAAAKTEESENVLNINTDEAKDKKLQESEVSYIIESGEITVAEKRKTNQVSISSFTRLEGRVKSLQAQVESLGIQVLPSDEALLSKTRSGDQTTPISDLLQAMNITKRMSGAEEGIDKLASLLETVAKEYADLKLLLDKVQDELGLDVVETMKEIKLAADYAKKMRPRADLYERALIKREKSDKLSDAAGQIAFEESHGAVNSAPSASASASDSSVADRARPNHSHRETVDDARLDKQADALERTVIEDGDVDKFKMLPDTNEEAVKINNLTMDQELIRRQMEFMTAQINTLADFTEIILPEILEGLPGMEELKKKIASIRGKTGSEVTLSSADWEAKRATLTLEQRVDDMESRLASHSSKLRRQDALFCDKYDTVLNQMRELQNGLTRIKLILNFDNNSGEAESLFDPQNIKMLMDKNEIISKEVEEMCEDITELKNEIQKNKHDFEGVIEEIEGIHSTKVDRFEIDDILADKADCSEVQCKVSTDIFEEFCNSLTKGVDYAIKNTVEQEKRWQKESEKMLEEMDRKLNKADVDPLKEELEKRIEELSARLDQVARMKTYTMAAGSKRRLYTEVNCVACDKKAAMEMEEERRSVDKACGLKPFLNAKPYISLELEQLKKMRIKSPGAKNMQLHEQIMKNYAISVGFDLLPEHEVTFVNRYCGGAETLTNPRQRVAKAPKNNITCLNNTTAST